MNTIPIIENDAIPDEAGDIESPALSYKSGRGFLLTGSLLVVLSLFVVDWLFRPDKFQIDEITINDQLRNVDGEQVKNVVQSALDRNYFSVDLKQLESEVEQLSWVLSASIRRQWPSTLVVDVTEIKPVARWNTGKWLDFTGVLVLQQPEDNEDYNDLPLLDGAEDQIDVIWKTFQQWSGRFAFNGLSLKALSLDSGGLFDFQLGLGALRLSSSQYNKDDQVADTDTGNVSMIVEMENLTMRVQRFMDALPRQLIIQFPKMETIDLRYPNGFAISWRDSGVASGILTESGVQGQTDSATGLESISRQP